VRDHIVARSYAETLFDLAERHEGLEAYGEAMERVARILDENPEARLFLGTPRIASAEKKRVLSQALEGRVPGHFIDFLRVIIDKRRQRALRGIATEFAALLDERFGRAHVEVTLARKPSAEAEAQIGRKLSEMIGKTAIPHIRVNPGILGGIVVKTGDTVYDGSLRRRLESMRRRLLAASLPSA
jgi:F-type H+-transporting ATPase subunit delta